MMATPSSPARVVIAPRGFVLLTTLALAGVQWGTIATADAGLPPVAWGYGLVGLLYAVAAVVALARRPTNDLGWLLALSGLLMIGSEFNVTGPSGMVAVSLVIAVIPLANAMHLVLAFPSGRLRSRLDRGVVLAAYAVCLLFVAPLYLFAPDGATVLSAFGDHPMVRDVARSAGGVAFAALALVAAWSVGRALSSYSERERRALVPLYGYGVLSLLLLPAAPNVSRLLGIDATVSETVQVATLAGIPIAFVVTLVAGGWARSTGTEDLSLRLTGRPTSTRDALALALGDPSVRLLEEPPEAPGADRGVVPVAVDGRVLGAIEYDARLISDPGTVRVAASIVAVSADRARLTAELRDASARMVDAADRERRRIARDLHDGLQAKLVLLALRAELEDDRDDHGMRDELTAAIDDLRAFVQGVMPAGLIERGLEAALEDLADRTPIATHLDVQLSDRRLPAAVENTAYFLVAEACANAVKHGPARTLEVAVRCHEEALHVVIADDGQGGAVAGPGLGLRNMRDRVEALGGTLTIDSPPGGGTRLAATLPVVAPVRMEA